MFTKMVFPPVLDNRDTAYWIRKTLLVICVGQDASVEFRTSEGIHQNQVSVRAENFEKYAQAFMRISDAVFAERPLYLLSWDGFAADPTDPPSPFLDTLIYTAHVRKEAYITEADESVKDKTPYLYWKAFAEDFQEDGDVTETERIWRRIPVADLSAMALLLKEAVPYVKALTEKAKATPMI